MLHAMIMAGGGGTRFWPRSRQRRPKQFLTVVGDRSLLQQALDRIEALALPPGRSWVMTAEAWSAVSRMRDWERLATDGPDVWKAATAVLLGPRPGPEGQSLPEATATGAPEVGPLERDQVLIEQSAATRGAIAALLAAVTSPEAMTQ